MNELNTLYIDIDVEEVCSITIDVEEGIQGEMLPYYEGRYEVTPRKIQQKLNTKDKSMSKDVTIFAIPYNEVSNPYGGKTVTIGIE